MIFVLWCLKTPKNKVLGAGGASIRPKAGDWPATGRPGRPAGRWAAGCGQPARGKEEKEKEKGEKGKGEKKRGERRERERKENRERRKEGKGT